MENSQLEKMWNVIVPVYNPDFRLIRWKVYASKNGITFMFRSLILGSQFSSQPLYCIGILEIVFESSINSSLGINTYSWGKYKKRTITSGTLDQVCITELKHKVIKDVNFLISHKFIIEKKMRFKIYFF